MNKPASIRYFDVLLWTGLLLGQLALVLAWPSLIEVAVAELVAQGRSENVAGFARNALIAGAIINVLVFAGLWFLISRKRVGAARWALLALALYGLVANGSSLISGEGFGLLEALSLVSALVFTAAAAMLFRADARVWFARNPQSE